ncbi:MAG: hypothetical protein IKQ71_00790 [Lachnospiraceae bacterium]|nr:hypothetical protein [Lachnospiraceae bacterium]
MDSNIQFYHNLFLICGILGLMCLVAAVVLFFAFDIRKILGDMLGFNKKKEMHQMDVSRAKVASERAAIRQKSYESKKRSAVPVKSTGVPTAADRKFEERKASEDDVSRSRKLSESGRIGKQEESTSAKTEDTALEDEAFLGDDNPTEVLAENQAGFGDSDLDMGASDEFYGDDAPTDVLSVNSEAFAGDDNPTEVLNTDMEEFGDLGRGDTMVLNASMLGEQDVEKMADRSDIRTGFVVERQIIMTHTDELIQ